MLTKKQLAARVLAVGGSEIAALAGLSRWKKPIDVYLDKVKPPESNSYPSLAAELGDLIEEPIAKLAASRTGLFFRKCDTLHRDDKPFAIVTPDRAAFATREARGDPRKVIRTHAELAESVGFLEVKHTTMRLRYEWGEPGTDEVPDYFYPQGIWQLGIGRMQRLTFATLFDKVEFGLYPIDYRADLFEGLYEIAERFMLDHVLAQKPPPPDASDAYSAFLSSKFATSNGQLQTPSEQLEDKIFQWARLKACEKRAHELASGIGNELKAALGDDYGFAGPRFGKVLWIRPKPSTKTDWEACSSALLLIAQQLAETADPAARATLLTAAHRTAENHTTAWQAGAKLSPYFKKGTEIAALKSQPLKVELPALEAGDQKTEDDTDAAA